MSHAKPADERAGHRTAPAVLGDDGALVAPDLPEHLTGVLPRDLRDRWFAIWTSPVAAVLDPESDLEPMARLFRLYALSRKMNTAVENQIEWLSSARADDGRLFDPQFSRVALAYAAEIRQLEQTLGVTPRGRLVIGAAVAAIGSGKPKAVHDHADD